MSSSFKGTRGETGNGGQDGSESEARDEGVTAGWEGEGVWGGLV